MISIVTPVYNEEGNVVYFHDEVTKVMKDLGMDYEIIYVNDGSRDRTDELIHQLADHDPHVRALTFARNFGHQIAITCGMDFARGDAVIPWMETCSIRRPSFPNSLKNGRKAMTLCRPSAPPPKTPDF